MHVPRSNGYTQHSLLSNTSKRLQESLTLPLVIPVRPMILKVISITVEHMILPKRIEQPFSQRQFGVREWQAVRSRI